MIKTCTELIKLLLSVALQGMSKPAANKGNSVCRAAVYIEEKMVLKLLKSKKYFT